MDRDQARAVIAEYLVGRQVTAEHLREALAALKDDAEYVAHLYEELGLDPDWESDCEAFREALPEFSELSAAARAREMPEMSEHLRECQTCRELYWDVRDVWGTIGQQGRAVVKRLTDAIHVVVDRTGSLAEVGPEFPSAPAVPVGATMSGGAGADSASQRLPQEWRLEDDDLGVTVRMTVEGTVNGVQVRWSLQGSEGAVGEPIAVELTNAAGEVFLKSSLAFHGTRSVPVSPGSWQSRILRDDVVWEIPLVIDRKTTEDGR